MPISNTNAIYHTFVNNNIIDTKKLLTYTPINGLMRICITQQNGYQIDLNNVEYNFEIMFFKN